MACELLLGAMSALPEEAEIPAELVRAALLAVSFDIRPDTAGDFSVRPHPPASGALAGLRERYRRAESISEYLAVLGLAVTADAPMELVGPVDQVEDEVADSKECTADNLGATELLPELAPATPLSDLPANDDSVAVEGEKIPYPNLGALSEREMGIAVLVSMGRTNQQIARALGLSHKTVETYLTRIFRKLDVCSRSQIA